MATPFRLKRSAVPGKRPTLSDLQLGELGFNTYDAYLFATRDASGVGIGTTVTLLTPWTENFGAASIYYQNTVGIGTTNPTSKFTVQGDVLISGFSTVRSDLTVAGVTTTRHLNVIGFTTVVNQSITGVATIGGNLSVSGVSTFGGITTVTGTTLFSRQLNVAGVSTFNQVKIGFTTISAIANDNYNSTIVVGDDLYIYQDRSPGSTPYNTIHSNEYDLYLGTRGETGGNLIFTWLVGIHTGNDAFSNNSGWVSLGYGDDPYKLTTIGSGVTVSGTTFTNQLNVSGVSTLGTGVTITSGGNINAVSGVVTAAQFTTGVGAGITITTNTIFAPQLLIIDPSPAGVGTTSGVVQIKGDLYVDGTQFVVNSTTIELGDFNIGIATTVGTNALLDGAGLGIGSANIRKNLTYANGSDSLKSSENFDLASGKVYKINGTEVLSATQLTVANINAVGVSTLGTLAVAGVTTTRHLNVVGFTTVVNQSITGVATVGTLAVSGVTTTQHLNVSGVSTFSGAIDANSTSNFQGDVTLQSNLILGDNDQIELGASTDLLITHLSSTNNSLIRNSNTLGSFIIDTAAGSPIELRLSSGGEKMGVFTPNGAVELYYDNVREFETTGYGATVFGVLQTQGLNITGFTTVVNQSITGVSTAGTLAVSGVTTTQHLNVVGFTTVVNQSITGVATIGTLAVSGVTTTQHLNVVGFTTVVNQSITGVLTVSNGIQGIGIQSGGSIITTGIITSINFVGAGNSFSYNAGTKTVDINIGGSQWTFVDPGSPTVSSIYRVNGNVGIGTTNPTSKLDVVGDIKVSGVSTFQGNVYLGDNDSLYFGDGNDLQIYSDGTNSFIREQGPGFFFIDTNNVVNIRKNASEDIAKFNVDGAVELYYDNSKEFETTGYGATVFGVLESQGLNITGFTTVVNQSITGVATVGSNLSVAGVTTTQHLNVTGFTTVVNQSITGVATIGTLAVSGVTTTQHLNVTGFTTVVNQSITGVATVGTLNVSGIATFQNNVSIAGVATVGTLNVSGVSTFQGNVQLGDNDQLILGDGGDLKIVHTGSSSFIQDLGTGALFIDSSTVFHRSSTHTLQNGGGTETLAVFTADGSVALYYDNSKEFETTGYGATIFGILDTQGLNVIGIATVGSNLAVSGITTVGSNLAVAGVTTTQHLNVSGFTTVVNQSITGVATVGTLAVSGVTTTRHLNVVGFTTVVNQSITGVATAGTLAVSGVTTTQHLNVSGIATLNRVAITTEFNVYAPLSTFHNDVNINGNLSIGGTTVVLNAAQLQVKDKDIVLGVTTNALGNDVSKDSTANHGGIAIASTEGTPLIDINIVGIDTIPSTYKQIMWIAKDTLGAGTTDAWHFNYGVGIGSTQIPNGVRLAVGRVQVTDNTVSSENLSISGVATVGSNLTVAGVTSTRHLSVTGFTTTANQSITGVATIATLAVTGVTTTQHLNVIGIATVQSNLAVSGIATVGSNLAVSGVTTTQHLNVTGFTTVVNQSITGVATIGTLAVSGVTTTQHLSVSGITTISVNSSSNALRITQLGTGNALVVEDETNPDATPFVVTASGSVGIGTTNPVQKLHIENTGTEQVWIKNGPAYLYAGHTGDRARIGGWNSSTGATNLVLNDAGGNVGVGTTNPTSRLDVVGDAKILGVSTFTATNAAAIVVRSGFTTAYTAIDIGRVGSAGIIGVAANAGEWAADSAAGDTIIRANATNSKLLFNYLGGNASLAIAGSNVLVGSVSSTGTVSQPLQVTGGAYFSGAVGIGTTNPGVAANRLSVSNSSGGALVSLNDGGTTNRKELLFTLDTTNNNAQIESLQQGVAFRPLLLNVGGGFVGIGTTNATNPLTIFRNNSTVTNTGTHLNLENPNASPQTVLAFTFGGVARSNIRADGSGNLLFNSLNNSFYFNNDLGGNTFSFLTTGVTDPWLRVSGGNKVGIATTNPVATLQVKDALTFETTNTTTTNTNQVAVDTFATATFRSAKYQAQITCPGQISVLGGITTGGRGYTAGTYNVTFTTSSGNGSAAQGTLVVSNGTVGQISVSAGGTGYVAGDVLTAAGGSGLQVSVGTTSATGAILTLGSITSAGVGYTAGVGVGTTTLTFLGGTGFNAVGLATIFNGVITSSVLLQQPTTGTGGTTYYAGSNYSTASVLSVDRTTLTNTITTITGSVGVSTFTSLTEHGIGVSDVIRVSSTSNGLTAGVDYYVVSVPSTTTFTLGSAVGVGTTFTAGTSLSIGFYRNSSIAGGQVAYTNAISGVSTNHQVSDLMVLQGGTNADFVEYATIANNDILGTFAADISGANARLLFTPTYPNNTIKVARQAITV